MIIFNSGPADCLAGRRTNKLLSGLIAVLAIFLILLGGIFIIAGGMENIAMGTAMVLVAVGLLIYIYRLERIEAAKPKLINQTFNVQMGGSGKLDQKQLTCRRCGAPLEDKDLRVVQGGIMVKCPYCGTAYALEEAPKW